MNGVPNSYDDDNNQGAELFSAPFLANGTSFILD